MTRNQQIGIAIAVLGTALVVGVLWPDRPFHDGKIRQTAQLRAAGLRRGAEGAVYLTATGHYTRRDADDVETYPVTSFGTTTLTLVDGKGQSQPIKARWSWSGNARKATLTIPDVPDGDYKLHAAYSTALGKGELDLPLPLYAPARIHVITDRPLYEPGNTVRFRAVVLRARDLVPLDGRPGTWVVTDPDGEVLLEERAPAGEFGVVAGSFPLDRAAAIGGWRVAWVSGGARDEVPITVQPFTLPRFRVDVKTAKPFYQAGDRPVIEGAVVYSSGAPVAGAKLDVEWSVLGDWPAPAEWNTVLPAHAASGKDGAFKLAMPAIPADLQGKATVVARISAVDPGGDRVEAAAQVLLAQDAIAVEAVTELGNGLVQGFNNRMYLRVTTADGRVVTGTSIKVKRAWQGSDPGVTAPLDEDGVASVQLDPGPPVTVVIPAVPWRPAPRPPVVTRGEVEELIAGEGAPLADQVEMDRWLAALEPCAKWFGDDEEAGGVRVGLRVEASGAIRLASAAPSRLAQCAAGVLRTRRLPAGAERMYTVDLAFTDPDLPSLDASVESALDTPDGLDASFAELARGARDCLPRTVEGALPRALTWRARAGAKDVELTGWIEDPQGEDAREALGCVVGRIGAGGRIRLEEPAETDAIGLVRFAVSLPATAASQKPQPTTMIGYELIVSADLPGAPATILRVTPGEVPPLRMRVTPVLPAAGETLTAELIRGPTFTGTLPEELALDCRDHHSVGKLDAEHHAKLALPTGVDGWCQVTGGGQRALVYVKPAATLAVEVTPEQPTYAPGEQANLLVKTTVTGAPSHEAAVGLFGVDASLGQLVALPGAGDLARLQPLVGTDAPAFGVLDGQALALGRIRGANAAAATVLRVSSIPAPEQLDAVVNTVATTHFDAIEELTDHFYPVLSELYAQARAWEASAPPAEKMRPRTLAALWTKALAAVEKRGLPVTDAYGRRLRLRILPQDLLALTAPHVVVTGTRLPEDVENWMAWVAKEKP
jgi:hypothetical protein